MVKPDPTKQPSQTLARALLILEAFTPQQPTWGVRELARELGINPTTVHRLLTTLCNTGYLQQDPESQRYSLGPKVMKLAAVYAQHNPLPSIARRVFESYTDRFPYNFYLGTITNHYEVLYLAVLDGRGPIKIVVEPGGTVGVHSTALGKVLLAFQSDEYIREFLEQAELKAYTSRSITDPRKLWEQLQEIRRQGYAVNDGEQYEEIAAVGVPLFDSRRQVAAGVSLAYPRSLAGDERFRIDRLVALANEIAAEIAYRAEGMLPNGHLPTFSLPLGDEAAQPEPSSPP